jgi:hypothetical protein
MEGQFSSERTQTRGAGDAERARQYTAEMIALAPDIILAAGAAATAQPINALPLASAHPAMVLTLEDLP